NPSRGTRYWYTRTPSGTIVESARARDPLTVSVRNSLLEIITSRPSILCSDMEPSPPRSAVLVE
ncbi:MAG: hypothetical protein QXX84_09140, partial [Sulfolobales archaeon]